MIPFASFHASLLLAAAVRLGNGALHRAGHHVGIEDHAAIHVARRAADRLHQRGLGAQEPFLVRVKNGDQRTFGDVEAFAQQVDADEAVKRAEAQIADDLDALQRVDVGMHVAHAHAVFMQVLGEVLRHALGERGYQRAVTGLRRLHDLVEHVVHLGAGGAHFHFRVCQSRRADHLLGEDAVGLFQFPAAGCRRNGDRLRAHAVPFLEAERPVVHAGGEAEAILRERRLAAEVPAIHAADLRDRHVAFIDEDDGVVRDVLEERRRRFAGLASRKVARIVLDPRAASGCLQHFQVKARALLQPLGLEQAAGIVEFREAVFAALP